MAKHSHPTEPNSPNRLLVDSDAAFAAGDHDMGSTLLWQAAECALVNLAKKMGRPHDTAGEDVFHFVRGLDKQNGDTQYYGGFVAAELIGDNAKHHYIEREEMDIIRPDVHDFVEFLISDHVSAKSH